MNECYWFPMASARVEFIPARGKTCVFLSLMHGRCDAAPLQIPAVPYCSMLLRDKFAIERSRAGRRCKWPSASKKTDD
jgi:hypothetical protein